VYVKGLKHARRRTRQRKEPEVFLMWKVYSHSTSHRRVPRDLSEATSSVTEAVNWRSPRGHHVMAELRGRCELGDSNFHLRSGSEDARYDLQLSAPSARTIELYGAASREEGCHEPSLPGTCCQSSESWGRSFLKRRCGLGDFEPNHSAEMSEVSYNLTI
jgi:hypothetical protein